MADPLSITASIISIITATFEGIGLLSNTIKNIRHAPESVRGVQRELEQLTPLLARLELTVSERPAELILGPDIKLALENCNRACTDFSVSLAHWTRRSNDEKSSLLDNAKIGVLRQRRIRLLNDQLNQGIRILGLTLDTATYLKMSRQEQMDERTLLHRESRITRGANEARGDLNAVTKYNKGAVNLDENENENEGRRPFLHEISRQKTMVATIQRASGEAHRATVSEHTKQNIRDVKTTNNSIALTGFINAEREETNIDQNISQVHTDGYGISVAGVAKNIDISSLFSQMRSSK